MLTRSVPTAAAVLDVGRLVQSPIPNTFGYFLCCNVSEFKSRNPAASTKPSGAVFKASYGPIGGVT